MITFSNGRKTIEVFRTLTLLEYAELEAKHFKIMLGSSTTLVPGVIKNSDSYSQLIGTIVVEDGKVRFNAAEPLNSEQLLQISKHMEKCHENS